MSYQGPGLLLLVDGEELMGAKQNRVINTSLLVPEKQPVVVPVSCVEQGRWQCAAPRFHAVGRTLSSQARRKKLSRLARSVAATGCYDANQSEVWQDVDE